MLKTRMVLFTAIVACAPAPLLAGDAPAKLPKDGWWVRYFVTMRFEARPEVTAKRTYSLVGTTVENSVSCRWVEMKTVETLDGREVTDVLKFLVPERDLLEGERPLDSLVRCWRKFGDDEVEEMRFNVPPGERGLSASADYAWGRDFAVFPGPRHQGKTVHEARTVEYQRGRLELHDGQAFRRVATRRALTNGEKQQYSDEFTVWNDPVVAPAFAAAGTECNSIGTTRSCEHSRLNWCWMISG